MKLNAVGMEYLRSVCDKKRRDGLKSGWKLNECGHYMQVNYHYVINVLRCLGEAHRENE